MIGRPDMRGNGGYSGGSPPVARDGEDWGFGPFDSTRILKELGGHAMRTTGEFPIELLGQNNHQQYTLTLGHMAVWSPEHPRLKPFTDPN